MAKQDNNSEKKPIIKFILLGTFITIASIFAYKKISFALTHETTDNAQIETAITPVLPRVSGYVKNITVKDYDSVKAGQLLVELDDAELQTELLEILADYQQAEIDIVNAKAILANALVSLNTNKGNIDITKVKLQKTEEDYERDKHLYSSEAITKKQLDNSKFDFETAQKQLSNSKNDLASAESRITVLESSVAKSEAALNIKKAKIEQIKLKISYTKIIAPESGKIGKKNISEGQFVQAGTPLFSIVNDTTYWIIANFKENQIKNIIPGKEVNIDIDAYPDLHVTGTIESISEATGAKFSLLPPDNASGNFVKVTQRVPVKIKINNIDKLKDKLRAGLSVFVSINTKN